MEVERSLVSLDELVSGIGPGMTLAIPKDDSGAPMAAIRALIRRGVGDLHLLCVPASGFHADLLIGAGCVATVECGGIAVSEFGTGPRFREAVRRRQIRLKDSSCPVIFAGLQAGEKGAPFAAIRGIFGSDLLKHRASDWRVIDNPFADNGDPVVLVPALNPDVFVFHAPWGDRYGNVWIAGRRDLAFTAHAARNTLVTVERIWDGNLLKDEKMAAGTLGAVYVAALAHAPNGAWPMALPHCHAVDQPHIREYMRLAKSDEGFAAYLQAHVFTDRVAA
jgi:glutaconate CoA-transferase subunit A